MLTVEHIAAKARQLQARSGLVVELQLLELHSAETRQQGIADASRKLSSWRRNSIFPYSCFLSFPETVSAATKSARCSLICVTPGAIEQDADVVLFLYREEVYTRDTEEKGIAEVLIRKQRSGPIGDRRLRFVDRFARFEDLEP